MKRYQLHRNNGQRGFTLLELLLVVMMIGILASIGMGRYDHYISQSNRRAAVVELYAAQQKMERERLQKGSYDQLQISPIEGYTFDVILDDSSSGYKLSAIPTGAGGDATCGQLTIDQADNRTNGTQSQTIINPNAPPGLQTADPNSNSPDCWR